MKIALYIDPYISPRSSFYTKILLQEELQKKNIRLDICIPHIDKNTSNNEDCYIDKKYGTKMNYNIIYDFPNAKKYDALLLIHIWSKKWHNGEDIRKKVSVNFEKMNKPILCLKFDTTLEHRYINDYIKYGINSNYYLNLPSRWILPKNSKTFTFPQISNYSFPKPNSLSKQDFYKKYNIDENKKIIIFFMGRFKKWFNNKDLNNKVIYWFFENINAIILELNNLNYELIFKLHRSDGESIIKEFQLEKLKIIDQYDTYESIKYSDRSISYCTSMVYELYLYNLPVLELFEGIYYPGWLSDLSRFKKYNSPLKEYDNGKKIIYGTITSYDKLIINYKNILNTFINTKFNINEYKYLTNHPIHGNSYNTSISDIADILISNINNF